MKNDRSLNFCARPVAHRLIVSVFAATTALALTTTAGATYAVTGQEPPLPVPVEMWNGFYVGVHAGIGAMTGQAMDWHKEVFTIPDGDFDLNGFAALAGVQVGTNHQLSNIVYGVEGDWSWTGFSMGRKFEDAYVKAEMDWMATLRVRLGLTAGNAMAYVTGGFAIAQLNHCGNSNNDPDVIPCSIDYENDIDWDGMLPGLAVGAGVEARLSPHWSLKGEYLFIQMDAGNVVFDSEEDQDIDFSNRSHQLRIGLNYHFSGLPMAEELAFEAGSGPWNGFYAGAHVGVGAFTGQSLEWYDEILGLPSGDNNLNGFDTLVGVQAGINYQRGNIIYGVEADWSWIGFSMDRDINIGKTYVKAEMDWQATLRGRLGLTVGNAMAYVTGGLAVAQLNHCGNHNDGEIPIPCSNGDLSKFSSNVAWDGVLPGLVAGAGVEARLSPHWSLKGEYLFVQMDAENVVYWRDQDIELSNRSHQLRVGVNYHFSGLPMADELAVGAGSGLWNGFYGGVHGGIGAFTGLAVDWDHQVFSNPDGDIDLNGFAALAGVQAGYNHQVGNIIYGVEGDWSWTGFSMDREFYGDDYYVKAEIDWLATLRGRLGLTAGNAMAYVTGGLAIARLNHCGNYNGDAPCSIDDRNIAWDGVLPGLVAGAGVEARLSPHWSLKGEYLFVQMDSENVVYNSAEGRDIDFSNRSRQFRIGMNYHFGG